MKGASSLGMFINRLGEEVRNREGECRGNDDYRDASEGGKGLPAVIEHQHRHQGDGPIDQRFKSPPKAARRRLSHTP